MTPLSRRYVAAALLATLVCLAAGISVAPGQARNQPSRISSPVESPQPLGERRLSDLSKQRTGSPGKVEARLDSFRHRVDLSLRTRAD